MHKPTPSLNSSTDLRHRLAQYFSVFHLKLFLRQNPDLELYKIIEQVIKGQAVDLGGGVFKKRLNDNRYRSIILAKGGQYWIYEYLFSKKDRENIDDNELEACKILAKSYSNLSVKQRLCFC